MKKLSILMLLSFLFLGLLKTSYASPQEETFKTVRASVVIITTFSKISLSSKEKKTINTKVNHGYGTGFIVENDALVSFVMTVGHVCDVIYPSQVKYKFPDFSEEKHTFTSDSFSLVTDFKGDAYPALVFGISKKLDICLLMVKKINLEKLNLATNPPSYGEKVYSMGFPAGSFSVNVTPIFEGYFSGIDHDPKHKRSIFTIPTTNGSSGSPVFNEFGDVLGIVVQGNRKFENWNRSITHQQVVEFYNFYMKIFNTSKDFLVKKFLEEIIHFEDLEEDINKPKNILEKNPPDVKLPKIH